MTSKDLLQILKDSDLRPYEIAEAVCEFVKPELEEQVAYVELDDIIRREEELMMFYLAAYRLAN